MQTIAPRSLQSVRILWHCRQCLEEESVPFRERVLQASLAFWNATLDSDGWNDALREDAAIILSKILRKGTIYKSIEEMDFPALDGIAILLFEFVESALEEEETFD